MVNPIDDTSGSSMIAPQNPVEIPEQVNADLKSLIPSWTWDTDGNGIIVNCESAIAEVLGFSKNEVIGQPFFSFGMDAGEQKRLRDAVNSENFPFSINLQYQSRENKNHLIQTTLNKVVSESGILVGFRIESLPTDWQNVLEVINTHEMASISEDTGEPEKTNSNLGDSAHQTRTLLEGDDTNLQTPPNIPLSLKTEIGPKVIKPKDQKNDQALNGPSSKEHTKSLSKGNTQSLKHENSPKKRTSALVLKSSETSSGIFYSDKFWTTQANESLSEGKFLSSSGGLDMPPTLTAPILIRDQKTGVLEILDEQKDRKWSQDDQLLVQEVALQLGLALENAQLYTDAQSELQERVKAQEETTRRNTELAKLNSVFQKLTRLVSPEEIFEIVSSTTKELLNSDNIILTILDDDKQKISFPICLIDGEKYLLPERKLSIGHLDTVIHQRSSLFSISKKECKALDDAWDHPKGIPSSLIAVPLLSGEKILGVISAYDFENESAFEPIQLDLLSAVAAQTATALENTTLLLDVQEALGIIRTREKSQSNITRAVVALGEKGSSSLDFLLESLINATDCDRVTFAYINDTNAELIYCKPKLSQINQLKDLSLLKLSDEELPISDLVVSALKDTGYFSSTDPFFEQENDLLLEKLGCISYLTFLVESSTENLSFVLLENHLQIHQWQTEEINILRSGTDALRNTLVIEGLFKQVQTSLKETESLYTSSHSLALASTIQEMASAIMLGIEAPDLNRGVLVLFERNEIGQVSRMRVAANYHNGSGTPPPPLDSEYLVNQYRSIFEIQDPVFYDDLRTQNLEPSLVNVLSSQSVRSMGILPLFIGSNQIGVYLVQSANIHVFESQETRTLPPLAGQLSTAIQNLQLFEQTQNALAETGLLYKISSGISSATSMDEYVTLIGENALPLNADSVWLFSAKKESTSNSVSYEPVGTYSKGGKFSVSVERIDSNTLNHLDIDSSGLKVLNLASITEKNNTSEDLLHMLKLSSAAVIPLQTSGNPVGLIIVGNSKNVDFEKDELRTLQIVGNSIAIAMERRRLFSEAQQRALELQTAAEIARDTTSTLSLNILLGRIVNLLKERFGYYHCSIFLLNDDATYAIVEESTGVAGLEMKQRKHKLAVGSNSVVGNCTQSGESVLVNDVTHNPIYFPNPLLPETRSELGIPMKISGKVIGALDLQSSNINGFSDDEIKMLQILTDQISIAIENARAFEISQHAVDEMRELDRVKSQFLANMSHELRTPLNSVIGFSRVILKGIDGPINDIQEQDITAIYNSGMHLLNMINEILDLSKIEAGKMELQRDEISIVDVINSAITTATGLVKDKPIELIQQVPANLPLVKADEVRITQVLINLLSNAIKFTEKGTITVDASIKDNSSSISELLIRVIDTGIGIAEEDQVKLFQRFSQVDDSPTRKTGGTGLGLSICLSLVELHGGKIGLEKSEIGKGSIFYFTLPISRSQSTVDIKQLQHGENVILSIDDDLQVISLYERFLKPLGYEVVPLNDPTKAVERAIEIKPFAITLDIMMPERDGWQVLRDLKTNSQTRDIPVMVCSILEEENKGYNLGAADYLVKPFIQDDLINSINRLNRNHDIQEIMVIDDDPSDLRLLKKVLEEEGGYTTVLVDNGLSALKMMNDYTPDVIILDLFMPDMNGFDLLEKLNLDERLSEIPLIILTGADLNQDQREFLDTFTHKMLIKGSMNEKSLLDDLQETLRKIRPTKLIE